MSYPPPPNNDQPYGVPPSQPYGAPQGYPPQGQPYGAPPGYPPQGQAYGAPGMPYQVGVAPQSSGLATASMILGIISFVGFGILTGIPAVITGHMAMGQIKANPALAGSNGQAKAGLILGYISIGLTACLIVGLIAIAASASHVSTTP